jgi:hypothetical protein
MGEPQRARAVRVLKPLLLALLALGGATALRFALWRPLVGVGDPPADGYVRVAGIIHVHTTASDGGGTPEEVVEAGRAAGLQFLVITDHNTLDAKPVEGYRGPLLVLVGVEVSTTAGHLLGLGIPEPPYRFSGDARDTLEDIRDLGGVAVAAHPLSPREDLLWTGWDLPGPFGIEILSGDSEWRTAGWARLVSTAALYGLNSRYALLRSLTPPEAVLKRWDRLSSERDAPGIAGADAHSRLPVGTRSFRIPSYEALFTLAQNHVLLRGPLTGEAEKDGRTLVEALGRGHVYVGLDGLAPANAFSFVAEREGSRWTMGDTVPAGPDLTLRAGGLLPRGSRLTLLRDGEPIAEDAAPLSRAAIGPGIYRVEARVPGWATPFILSNPIAVLDPPAQARRAARAAFPKAPVPPAPALVLDAFAGKTIFSPEWDTASSMEAKVLDPEGGPEGRWAGRLSFRLGDPTPGHPHTWCALVNRESRDLSGREGLVFTLKADGIYRFWVQVRDENPASSDDGLEWWFASVRTSREWTRIAIPFSRFRSINKKTDGRLDLDKVRQLVFLVDEASMKPMSRGNIWIAEFGAY